VVVTDFDEVVGVSEQVPNVNHAWVESLEHGSIDRAVLGRMGASMTPPLFQPPDAERIEAAGSVSEEAHSMRLGDQEEALEVTMDPSEQVGRGSGNAAGCFMENEQEPRKGGCE